LSLNEPRQNDVNKSKPKWARAREKERKGPLKRTKLDKGVETKSGVSILWCNQCFNLQATCSTACVIR